LKIIKKEMPDRYTVVQTQDWHIGSGSVYRDGIKDAIGRMSEPNVYGSLPGDLIEAIRPDDKRFAFCSYDHSIPTAQDQSREVAKLLKPVAKRIIGIGAGNHEWKLINQINIARDICERLKIPEAYGGWTFVLDALHDGATMHKMFFTHGNFSLNSQAKDPVQALANMKAKLKNVMVKTGFADCIYMGCGHTHRLMVTEPTVDQEPILITENGQVKNMRRSQSDQTARYIPPDARWYGNSGSFMRAYTNPAEDIITYAEVGGLGALDFGWLEIDVEDRQVVDVRKVVV
jgi:UDP-2,3-diacylglucosamine pyrophosphatase LpxH